MVDLRLPAAFPRLVGDALLVGVPIFGREAVVQHGDEFVDGRRDRHVVTGGAAIVASQLFSVRCDVCRQGIVLHATGTHVPVARGRPAAFFHVGQQPFHPAHKQSVGGRPRRRTTRVPGPLALSWLTNENNSAILEQQAGAQEQTARLEMLVGRVSGYVSDPRW